MDGLAFRKNDGLVQNLCANDLDYSNKPAVCKLLGWTRLLHKGHFLQMIWMPDGQKCKNDGWVQQVLQMNKTEA